jgi:hypothetical protein
MTEQTILAAIAALSAQIDSLRVDVMAAARWAQQRSSPPSATTSR